MIRKKSKFLTFCFAFIPGAGQMYMGFMKRGISLMSAFFLLIFLSTWLNLGPLMLVFPVIWSYAFFDTFNLRSLPDDLFYTMVDDYVIFPEVLKNKGVLLQKKYKNIIAFGLIIIGFSILWNNVYDVIILLLPYYLRDQLWRFGQFFPQMIIGFAIIMLGIYLIRGKKQELDMPQYPIPFDNKGEMNP